MKYAPSCHFEDLSLPILFNMRNECCLGKLIVECFVSMYE